MMTIYQKTFVFILCCLFLYTGVVMAQYETSRNNVEKPFPWPQGKRCAVSLTFDDARYSQVTIGIPLLNKYNVKAAFYVSPEAMIKKTNEWIAAVKDGHEIGNHTMNHPCSGNFSFARHKALEDYTLDRIAKEMDEESQLIFDRLKVKPISFAYPCGQKYVGRGEKTQSYVPVVAKKFLTGRGWLCEDSNDPWFCDFAQLMGMESDGKSFDELRILVEKAAAEGKWLILAGHEINNEGNQTTLVSSLEKLCQYAQNPDNGIWIDTVGSVAKYIQQVREESKPQ